MILSGILSILIGYLLGSIPTAYLVTRIKLKKDIRNLGGGNIGALNAAKEVGIWSGVIVALGDVGKGVVSVLIACFAFDLSPVWVMLTGIAAVAGHLWMLFLKFSGGRGMGTSVGVLLATMGVYNQWIMAGIFCAIILVPLLITFNVPFAMVCAFTALPFLTWFKTFSLTATLMSLLLCLLVGGKFLPTAIEAWRRAGSLRKLIFGETPHFKKPGSRQ